MTTQPYDVVVWVYDLSNGMAKTMSPMFLGRQIEAIYHTGIVIYGVEYFFGGGIASSAPGATQAGSPLRKVKLGTTNKTQQQFHDWLHSVGDLYTMQTYNVLSHNCNNFAAACAQFLLSGVPNAKAFPQEILDLPGIVLATPMGQMFKPMLEQMGTNTPGNSNSGGGFIPMATNHLDLPTATYNSPPTVAAAAATTTTPTTTTPLSPTSPKPIHTEYEYVDHRITSLSTPEELNYRTLLKIPANFPSMQHDQSHLIKMFALVKASYKNPSLSTHFTNPIVIEAQNNLQSVITQITEKMKTGNLTIKPNYVLGLQSLHIITQPYDTVAMLGNIGLYNMLLSQLLFDSIITAQESIETVHQQSQGALIHTLCTPLLTPTSLSNTTESTTTESTESTPTLTSTSSTESLTFDTFIHKCVVAYQHDVLPHLVSGTTTGTKLNPAILKLLSTNLNQLFYLTLELSLTPNSQLDVLRFVSSIIDDHWSTYTTTIDTNNNITPLLTFALELICAYISTLKTNYSSRPPKFCPARPIKLGIQDNNSTDNSKNDEINEFITEFYVTSVLKIQELFSNSIEIDTNPALLKSIKLLNIFMYIISYIANGTKQHCELLTSLDFEVFKTAHEWHQIIVKLCKAEPTLATKEDVQLFIQLLEDFDAVLVMGTRDRQW